MITNQEKLKAVMTGALRQAVVGKDRRIIQDSDLGIVQCLYQDMPVVVLAPDRIMLDCHGEPRDRGRVRAIGEFLRAMGFDISVHSDIPKGFHAIKDGEEYKPEPGFVDPHRILIPITQQ